MVQLFLAISFQVFFVCNVVYAQRKGDHTAYKDFWKKYTTERIDLAEKINKPLSNRNQIADPYSQYSYTQGLAYALLQGFREVKYPGYLPDNPNVPLSWKTFREQLLDYNKQIIESNQESGSPSEPSELNLEFEDFGDWSEQDELDFEDDDSYNFENNDIEPTQKINKSKQSIEERFLFAGLDQNIELIKLIHVDKTVAKRIEEIKYIRIQWVDPYGKIPSKNILLLRYDDVQETLRQARWPNPDNSSSDISILQALKLHLYHSYIIDISGVEMFDLLQANKQQYDLIQFEHHLWEF